MTNLILLHAAGTRAAGPVLAAAAHGTPAPKLTYFEAGLVGLTQGISELFPISSLGHSLLIPALVGGSWSKALNVSSSSSPYLAFIVGLHVATAIALLAYFWRDWVKIIRGFFSSLQHIASPPPGEGRWQFRSVYEHLSWMIIFGTIPVGLAGALFQKEFQALFGKAVVVAVFLAINGLILIAAERFRPRRSIQADQQVAADRDAVEREATIREHEYAGAPRTGGRHASGHQSDRHSELEDAAAADWRLSGLNYGESMVIGGAQVLALLAGISRDGVTLVTGMFRGLARQDAARFAFLLATPVILLAGVLKLPDLLGPEGKGILGPVIFGSVLSGLGAFVAVRFLTGYFSKARTLTPFGIYCLVAGLGCIVYLQLVK